MRVTNLFAPALLAIASTCVAQEDIFLGAGSTDATISVTTSSNHQLYSGTHMASGEKTINGDGMNGLRMEAGRFLSQASLAVDLDMIDEV